MFKESLNDPEKPVMQCYGRECQHHRRHNRGDEPRITCRGWLAVSCKQYKQEI